MTVQNGIDIVILLLIGWLVYRIEHIKTREAGASTEEARPAETPSRRMRRVRNPDAQVCVYRLRKDEDPEHLSSWEISHRVRNGSQAYDDAMADENLAVMEKGKLRRYR